MHERIIEHINGHDGVRWATFDEIADDFAQRGTRAAADGCFRGDVRLRAASSCRSPRRASARSRVSVQIGCATPSGGGDTLVVAVPAESQPGCVSSDATVAARIGARQRPAAVARRRARVERSLARRVPERLVEARPTTVPFDGSDGRLRPELVGAVASRDGALAVPTRGAGRRAGHRARPDPARSPSRVEQRCAPPGGRETPFAHSSRTRVPSRGHARCRPRRWGSS